MRFLLVLLLCLAAPAWGLERVSLQLKWKHQFQFAGYYAAVEKGFYRAAGLEVELREAEPEVDSIEQVLAGKADFGVGTSDLVLARATGKPVVALAVILQHSPLVLLARQDRVHLIQDLVGKRVMAAPGETELFAYLRREGLQEGSYELRPNNFDTADLVSGKVDALSAYATDETFALRQAGFAYSAFSPRSAGVDFYGDNLFTSERLLKHKPSVVAAFREASLEGWRYAMQHPEEVADLILAKYGRRHSRAHLLFEAAEMRHLMQPDLVEIGQMSPGRWQHIAQVYAELGLLPAQASIDGLVYDPRPTRLPFWVMPSIAAAVFAFMLIGAIAWRFAFFNRALNAEVVARKEAERISRASAENFRRLMDVAPVSVVVVGAGDSRILYLNEHALHEFALGKRAEDTIGRSTIDFYRDAAERRRFLDELERSGLVTEMPLRGINGRGKPVDILASARIIDFEGHPAIYAVLIDITERNRAEAILRASEAQAQDANVQLRLQLDEIAKLQSALKEQAIRDGLTGFYNRRYLDETLAREMSRAQREGAPLSVVMLDIDHFKQLNDTYGHLVGDEALRTLAEQLRQDVRSEDVPCRYGGEEFLILMPRMPLSVAAERAERWCRAIEAIRLEADGAEIGLTVSMGVAAYPEHGTSPDTLAQSADLALYLAKRKGRNRVVVCGDGMVATPVSPLGSTGT